MNLQEQQTFLDELSTLFLDLDRKFCIFEDYDGHYGEYASKIDECMQSIWRLQDLED